MKIDKLSFWKPRSIQELAKEQGIKPLNDFDDLIGRGKKLWKNDREFEKFVAGFSRPKQAAHV